MRIRTFVIIICFCALCTFAMLLYMHLTGIGNVQSKPSAETVSESETAQEESRNLFEESTADSSSAPQEEDEGLYDSTAVTQAYKSGDTSKLAERELAILEAAKQAIDDVVTEDMTDYEKELAIHDYIITVCSYDEGRLGVFEEHDAESVNPYGALVKGKAICSGYTTTFQMFMDMLDIPCISIQATDVDDEEHAWNMVQINGNWYYTDVTWDDPVPDEGERPNRHKYFNVTGEFMAQKHVWDMSEYPVADSWEDSYIAHNLYKISDYSEIIPLMEQRLEMNSENLYLEFDSFLDAKLETIDEIDTRCDAADISKEFSKVLVKFSKEHSEYYCYAQRVELDGRIVAAIYIRLI